MTNTHPYRRWTSSDVDTLTGLLRDGANNATLERVLGRSPGAIWTYLNANGRTITDMRRVDGGCRTAKEVAELLGAGEKIIRAWIAAGELAQSRRAQRPGRAPRWITDDSLMTFLAFRPAWPEWSPENITDRDWREYAQDLRAAAGGHWLSTTDIAARYHVTRTAVGKWITAGLLPSIRRRYHYVWSTDLDGFTPPFDAFDSAARSAANRRAWVTRRQQQEATV